MQCVQMMPYYIVFVVIIDADNDSRPNRHQTII